MKVLVFPVDSLVAYVRKGEVKQRYYNPENLFDEVHIIDFSTHELTDSELEVLAPMAGDAKLIVHRIPVDSKIGIILARTKALNIAKAVSPDVIRAHGIYHEGFSAAYCRRSLDVPLVVSCHGDFVHHKYLLMRKESIIQGVLHWIFQLLFRRYIAASTDQWIYVDQAATGTTGGLSIPEDRQHIIYNRVYYDKPKEYSNNNDTFHLIYVGNFYKVKNQAFLLEVIKELDVRLTLVGRGKERESLMSRAQNDPQLRDKVDFVEAMPNKDLHRLYRDADLFIHASLISGVAIPIIEAMSLGLPIVHRKLEGREIGDPIFEACLQVPLDVKEYRAVIARFMQDPELCKQVGKKSLEVFKRFTGERMERLEAGVYSQAIDGS